MDLKKTNAPVNTITYNKTVIEEPTGNVYEAITIMAKRANQINSEIKKELTEKLEEFATYNDSLEEVFENKEQIEVINVIKLAIDIFNEDNIQFQTEESEVYAFLDKTQLIRIITNLVKNALQATEEEENPRILVAVTSFDNSLKITVSDNGKGIADEMKDLIFEPKFTTKTSGMGLGLAMIKSIIEAYDGTISFVSEKNKGTTFTVILPKK